MNNIKKYLPSKKFIASILTIIIVFSFAVAIKELFNLIKRNSHNKNEPSKVTIKEAVEQDSNKNGIADWEEYIWGLDPTKNGSENKEFILAKKKYLVENGEIITSNKENSSDNAIVAQQLLATIINLSGSDQISEETINSLSDAIGQQIVTEELPDKYTKDDVKIVDSTKDNIAVYGANVLLLSKMSDQNDIGKEMTLISQGLANKDAIALRSARTIASSYRVIADVMSTMDTPTSVYLVHLDIMNNYEKIAQSIEGLSLSLVNQTDGLKSLINYKNYEERLAKDFEELSNYFETQ